MPNGELILDLDGTISDPSVGTLRSINYALTSFGYPELLDTEVSACIGPPLDVIFGGLVRTTSPDRISELVAKYRERYMDIGYAENALYPGIAEALAMLARGGTRLGVCTSKRVDIAERILEMFGLRSCFAFVSGGDVGVAKSAQLSRILSDGLATQDSIMVGDRAVDVLAGRASSLRTAGVLWGHGSESELVDAGAERLLTDPSQLVELAEVFQPARRI